MRTLQPLSVVLIMALFATSACTGDDQGEEPDRPQPPYAEALFDDTTLCDALAASAPRDYFHDNPSLEGGGSSRYCLIDQVLGQEHILLGVDVLSDDYVGWDEATPERFADLTQGGSIPVEGLGEKAAIAPPFEGHAEAIGLSLYVQEGNLVLVFTGYSELGNLDGPRARTIPLADTAQALVEAAELYLSEIGAENAEVEVPPEVVAGQYSSLPDLCTELTFSGFDPSGDQEDWPEESASMDRCHWDDLGRGADLWLSAEAVGPLDVAGVPAEEFAQWWIRSLPASGGDDLGLAGDEDYASSLSAEEAGSDTPTRDFAIRFDNVVVQGRYAADLQHEQVDAELQAVTESIGSQMESILDAA